jgi:hypothetical protein
MNITLPAFTPVEESLFLTQCGRALDNRSPHPILADAMAAETIRKLGYDCGRFRLSTSPISTIALRAKKLDKGGAQVRHPAPPTRSGSTSGPGWIPASSASPRRPPSTGMTSTSPRSSPPGGNCCQSARMPT